MTKRVMYWVYISIGLLSRGVLTKYNPPRLSIECLPIALSKHLRYLGIILDTLLLLGSMLRQLPRRHLHRL